MAKKFSFLEVKNCPFCNSNNFVKDGISAGKQRYWCKSCNKVFTSTTGTMLLCSDLSQEYFLENSKSAFVSLS